MNTTSSASPYALSLTIKGTSGVLTTYRIDHLDGEPGATASLTATRATPQIALSWPATVGATGYHVKPRPGERRAYVTVACSDRDQLRGRGLANGTTYY